MCWGITTDDLYESVYGNTSNELRDSIKKALLDARDHTKEHLIKAEIRSYLD